MTNDPNFPEWDSDDTDGSLSNLYAWTIAKAREQINWYERKRPAKKIGSQTLRAVAISFAGVGVLCPLIAAINLPLLHDWHIAQWGYVALALAASLIGYDTYFGISSGWMRYVVTQLSLERALKNFEYSWLANTQEQPKAKDDVIASIQRLKAFSAQVDTLVEQETSVWVSEFQSNLSALEEKLKTGEPIPAVR